MSDSALQTKKSFIKLVQLPDLAIYNEDFFIRHRTLATVFDIYSEDGSLRESSKASFIFKVNR